MKWKILYSNGSYSDEDGMPELAPKRDVQAILVRSELSGRRIERQTDFYIYSPEQGGWRGVDHFGLWDYLSRPGYKIVLFGRYLNDEEFAILLDKANADPDFPARSAYQPSERRSKEATL